MTTVNVKINQVGCSERLYLSNGLWGPATAVLHYMWRACQDGTIVSDRWNVAQVDETTTGAVVRAALAKTDGFEPHFWHDGEQDRLAAYVSQIDDNADYEVHCIEV